MVFLFSHLDFVVNNSNQDIMWCESLVLRHFYHVLIMMDHRFEIILNGICHLGREPNV
jgi:hypothetical protein